MRIILGHNKSSLEKLEDQKNVLKPIVQKEKAKSK